jgi:hypothetical protein
MELKRQLEKLSLSDLVVIRDKFTDEAVLDWKYGKENKSLYDAVQFEILVRIKWFQKLSHTK